MFNLFFWYLANFKLTISDIKGKSTTKELKDNDANPLIGLTIGKETDATIVGLEGMLKITGGSDRSGVPMRSDVHGEARKYVLLSKGVGLQKAEKGQRFRKLVRGNSISEETYQINCRFDGEIPTQEAPKADDAAPEKKKEAPKADDTAKKTKEAPKADAAASKKDKKTEKKE